MALRAASTRTSSVLGLRALFPSLSARSLHVSAPLSGGAGQPVGAHIVPDAELPESEELTWDDGSPFPEPCPDVVAPHFSENKGLLMLASGLGLFGVLGVLAKWDDRASRVPWTPREVVVVEEV